MARYIKANPKVAKYLNLENDRNTVSDGNFLLWQNDMLHFGPLIELDQTLALIGGIALMPHEARAEQDGTVCRPLPVATDPRFIIEPVEPEAPTEESENENTGEGTGESEAQTDDTIEETPANDAEAETPVEETPESSDEAESIDSGDVGSVEDVLNNNDKEE